MARKAKKKAASTRKSVTTRTSRSRKPARAVTRTVVKQVRTVKPKPVTDVITEERHITTVPEVEIRRPATLAAAFSVPTVAVVKPKTKVTKTVRRARRVA